VVAALVPPAVSMILARKPVLVYRAPTAVLKKGGQLAAFLSAASPAPMPVAVTAPLG
jgi:hypothetical protein